jgi:predicted O-methyltransferase YrrM
LIREMKITDQGIEKYLMDLSFEDDPHILEMERIAKEKNFPIVDRLVGRLLFVLTRIRNPRLIVELGSGFGYSAYWFALALGKGKIVLTDYEEGHIGYAEAMFEKAGMRGKVEFRLGEALEIIEEYEGIDILFIDLDKWQYVEAVRRAIPRLSTNALVIADNTLWYGKVLEERGDRDTEGIKEFNQYMYRHGDFFTTIIPLRDGILLAYKMS